MFSLGQRIRNQRLQKRLTQTELAKGICTPSMISQVEADRARPSYNVLFKIAARLDIPLDHLLGQAKLNLEDLSTYTRSRALLASEDPAAAVPMLQDLLDHPRPHLSRADLLHDLAACCLRLNRLSDAEDALEQAVKLALFQENPLLLIQLYQLQGEVAYSRRQYQLAEHHWKSALRELTLIDCPDPALHACLLYNLGRVAPSNEALDYYRRAAVLFEGSEGLHGQARAYADLGQDCLDSQDLVRAGKYSERAAHLFQGANLLQMCGQLRRETALLDAKTGRQAEAFAKLDGALALFRQLGCSEEEGITWAELAALRLQAGDGDGAEAACLEADRLLPDSHPSRPQIDRVRGGAARLRGESEAALKLLSTAADAFLAHGELREWDGTLHEIARLHADAGDLLTACRLLDDARVRSRELMRARGIRL